MEQEKVEPRFIKMFLEKRCIWENKDCYIFLNKRQYEIAKIMLKKLYELQPTTQQKLLQQVTQDYEKFSEELLTKYERIPSKIINSNHKWLIRKKRNTNEYLINKLSHSSVTILNYMVSFFIWRKQIWDSAKQKRIAYILQLNSRGKLIVNKLMNGQRNEQQ